MGLNLHNELSGWLEAISYMRNIIATIPEYGVGTWSNGLVKFIIREDMAFPSIDRGTAEKTVLCDYGNVISLQCHRRGAYVQRETAGLV